MQLNLKIIKCNIGQNAKKVKIVNLCMLKQLLLHILSVYFNHCLFVCFYIKYFHFCPQVVILILILTLPVFRFLFGGFLRLAAATPSP